MVWARFTRQISNCSDASVSGRASQVRMRLGLSCVADWPLRTVLDRSVELRWSPRRRRSIEGQGLSLLESSRVSSSARDQESSDKGLESPDESSLPKLLGNASLMTVSTSDEKDGQDGSSWSQANVAWNLTAPAPGLWLHLLG